MMTSASLVGCWILAVEDETLVAVVIEEALQELGCIVVGPVARLDAALQLARDEVLDAGFSGRDQSPYPRAICRAAASTALDGLGNGNSPIVIVWGLFRDRIDRAVRSRCSARTASRKLATAIFTGCPAMLMDDTKRGAVREEPFNHAIGSLRNSLESLLRIVCYGRFNQYPSSHCSRSRAVADRGYHGGCWCSSSYWLDRPEIQSDAETSRHLALVSPA